MPFYPPNFNLLASAWNALHVPNIDFPDWEDVPCQLYLESRPSGLDTSISDAESWTPSVLIRFPKILTALSTTVWIWEVPAGSERYYRVFFKETCHMGFPNEYLVHFCTQCGPFGLPFLRDVEAY